MWDCIKGALCKRFAVRACAVAWFALGLVAGPASAQVTVLGGGLARECYEAVRRPQIDAASLAGRDALAVCTRALEHEALDPGDRAATLANRGILWMRGGELARAQEDFERAVALNGMSADLALNLGALRLYQGRAEDALALLQRAVDDGASEPHAALYNRAVVHEALGDLRSAYADYRAAQALAPDWPLPGEQLARFTVTPAAG